MEDKKPEIAVKVEKVDDKEIIKEEKLSDDELKVVVKNQPPDSSMMNINDKTDQLASNDSEALTCKDQEFAGNLNTSETAPMTLLSVQLEEQNLLAQALQNQPEGTQLIVHIQGGPPGQVQVLVDGKLVPVSNISQVLTQTSTTTTVSALPNTFQQPAAQPRNSRINQKTGKKRKQILDEETQLSGASFKSQLLNTSDIVKGLDLAPPTKQVMEYTSTIDSDTLFGFPGRPHSSQQLLNVFSRNLTAVRTEDKKRKKTPLKDKALKVKYDICEDIVSWL
ncbi:uncharacterized protein [Apostichopus japonicus]|uniref:uncharacterized protein n=1 Tax=Stichopus japonicus TaxID=307972 RepID=UPI003AB74DFC